MKVQLYLLTVLLLGIFTTETYAATVKHSSQGYSLSSYFAKYTKAKKANHTVKTKAVKPAVKVAAKAPAKPAVKVIAKAPAKPAVKVATKASAKPDDKEKSKEIVKIDFKEEIKELSKSHDDEKNIYLAVSKKDKDGEHENGHHDDGHGHEGNDDHVNAVPVPAALWLFGPVLLGLLGAKRKEA